MAHWRLGRIKAFSLIMVGASMLALLATAVAGHGEAHLLLRGEWVPSYHSALRLDLDAVSLPFALNLLGVALVTLAYAWGYFHEAPRPHLLYALLLAFVASMLGTCLFGDVILFFICWEGMLVSSSLLLLGWGEGASPVIHGDNLIVNWDHEGQSFLVVLDAATGETKWRVERDEVTSWTTPLPVEYQGRVQLIVPATRQITSYDLDTGEIVWQCGGMTTNVIPTPLEFGETVICMSGHRGSAAVAVRLDSRGDVTDDPRQIVWRLQRDTPYVPSPILYGDLLYFTKSNTPILTCVEPSTGKVLTDGVRLPGIQSLYASPVAAAGRIYFTSREGVTLVVKNQAALEVLATNRLPDGIDASPAIVGNALFLRTHRHLVCVAEP